MALGRYKIYRGKRPSTDPLPEGIRQDTRKHTSHVLRPPADLVRDYLNSPDDNAWKIFETEYHAGLARWHQNDPSPFDRLATLAQENDVWLGCSCPTRANPNPAHCHTMVALAFMKKRYPNLPLIDPT